MPKTTLSLLLLCSVCFLQAQPAPKASPDALFSAQLNKVLMDYPANFQGIQGSRLPAEVGADAYLSTLCLPGALACKVMRFHSVEDQSASWQAVFYEGESFEEALKLYKKIVGLLKKTTLRGAESTGAGFEGKLEPIDENVGFAVSSLRLRTKQARYRDLVAEVNISSDYTHWQVHLDLYTKKRLEEEAESDTRK